jgi:AbiV family abortive infection protein
VESRGGDAGKLAHAREHCQKAQALHEQGKHADSVISAGDAIEEAGKAAK